MADGPTRQTVLVMIDKDAEWWLAMAKKEGDYPVEVPYSGTPCLCGERREEDCNPRDCERPAPVEERLAAVMRDNGLECRDANTFDELLLLLDADMKATTRTINRLREELEAGAKWAHKYERENGPFKTPPPDHLIGF